MSLLDAYGRPVGLGPRPRLSKFFDASRKIFEGPVEVEFWDDRLVAKGICYHCSGRIEYMLILSKGQAKACSTDQQFRKNMFDLMLDNVQDEHQCPLVDEGKDNIFDIHHLVRQESRERRT